MREISFLSSPMDAPRLESVRYVDQVMAWEDWGRTRYSVATQPYLNGRIRLCYPVLTGFLEGK